MEIAKIGNAQTMLAFLNEKDSDLLPTEKLATGQVSEQKLDSPAVISSFSKESKDLSQTSLIGNMFFDSDKSSLKHLDAIQKGRDAEAQVALAARDVIMDTLPDAVKEAAFWLGSRRMQQAKIMKDTQESHEVVLSDIRDQITENVEKAAENSDSQNAEVENAGTPIESTPEPQPGASADSIPVPQPDAAAVSSASMSQPEMVESAQVEAPPAPSAPSIDIIV